MQAQAFEQAGDLAAGFVVHVAAQGFVLHTADVELAAGDGAEQGIVIVVEEVEAGIRAALVDSGSTENPPAPEALWPSDSKARHPNSCFCARTGVAGSVDASRSNSASIVIVAFPMSGRSADAELAMPSKSAAMAGNVLARRL